MWKDYQGAFWVWLAVVVAILGLRGAGALQPIELAVYDRLLGRLERPATVSSRVALIEISEQLCDNAATGDCRARYGCVSETKFGEFGT